jgi:hypothetical protein
LFNTSSFFRIAIDNILVGSYRLQLNLLTTVLTSDLKFISTSTKISPIYSIAMRENGFQSQNVLVNSYVSVRIYARNIHNQTIDKNADAALLLAQCRFYITGSNGQAIHMNFFGTFNDSRDSQTSQIYYNFTTVEPIKRNGKYVTIVYFVETDQYMHVINGTFILNDKFDPLASELYLIKGLEQKEFRMIPYDQLTGVENSFNASHYDPRIDGSLRFKLYFRTNVINEIVSQTDVANIKFVRAYLA